MRLWPSTGDDATFTDLAPFFASCLNDEPASIAMEISDDADPHIVGFLNHCGDEGGEFCPPELPQFRGMYIRGSTAYPALLPPGTDAGAPVNFIFGVYASCGLGIFFEGEDIFAAGFQSGFANDDCGPSISFPSCPMIVEDEAANFTREEGVVWAIAEGSPTVATPFVLIGTSADLDGAYEARGAEPGGIIVRFGQVPVFDEETVVGCPYELLVWPDRSSAPVSLNSFFTPAAINSFGEGVRDCSDDIVRACGHGASLSTGGGAVLVHDVLGTPCGRFLDDVTIIGAPGPNLHPSLFRAYAVNDQGLVVAIGVYDVGASVVYETFVITHRADLNGDAYINGADIATVLGYWATNDPRGDASGDGFVGGADIAVVLGAWSSSSMIYLPSPCSNPGCPEEEEEEGLMALMPAVLAYGGFADFEEFAEWAAVTDESSVSSMAGAMACVLESLR